ncbi:MAG: hypothetical protein RXR16_07425 [Thermocladium sp.]
MHENVRVNTVILLRELLKEVVRDRYEVTKDPYSLTLLRLLVAFKVIELKRGFNRHQFARPLLAVLIAGLSWNDLDEGTGRDVAELSRTLHSKVPREEYGNQRVALKVISELNEFRKLKSILDSKVDKERLEEALKLVS